MSDPQIITTPEPIIMEVGVPGPTGPAGWAPATAWVSGASYVAGPPASLVTWLGDVWLCTVSHISGDALDLSKWLRLTNLMAAFMTPNLTLDLGDDHALLSIL